jgi:hypothetical protein
MPKPGAAIPTFSIRGGIIVAVPVSYSTFQKVKIFVADANRESNRL